MRAPKPTAAARPASTSAPSRRRRGCFAVLLALVGLAILELASWGALTVLDRRYDISFETVPVEDLHQRHRDEIERLLAGEQGSLMFDAELGWDLNPGAVTEHFTIDALRVRTDESFEVPKPPGIVRVALCGDSFSFGADVITPYTLAETLMRLEPGVEVVNLAVPAYGPDQAWLRCRRMMGRYQAELVIIGFIADNAGRVVNTFRPFYFFKSGLAMGKPRFVLNRDGGAELVPNPLPTLAAYRELLDQPRRILPRLGQSDFHYRTKPRPTRFDRWATVRLVRLAQTRLFPREPMWDGDVLNPEGEPLRVSAAVLAGFAAEVESQGIPALIALLPSRFDIQNARKGNPTAYHHLGPMLETRGLRVVDVVEGFQQLAPDLPLRQLARVHYTRFGNEIAARWIDRALREHQLIPQRSAADAGAQAERTRARLGRLPSVQALSAEEINGLLAEVGTNPL